MTKKDLVQHILKQKNEVEKLPALPKKLGDDFDNELIREQVYHSSKLEGSTVRLKDIKKMV